MTIYSIYKATNIINGKIYIGFTSLDPLERWNHHRKNSKTIRNKFYNAINKYGWDNFLWEIIYQSLDLEHTHKVMENYFIVFNDSFKNGYNMTLGGEGIIGFKFTDEQCRHRSDIAKKFYASKSKKELIKKFGKSGSQNHFYNKKHSSESIFKMKEGHIKQRTMLFICEVCNKKVDAQNYALHHGDKCGTGSGVRGRKWYHSEDKVSYYLLPTDSKITELNLILGRVSKKKLGRQKVR